MINFERLEKEKDALREKFLNAKPFPHIAIDDFLEEEKALELYEEARKIGPREEYKIPDPVFSKNRYQFPDYKKFGPIFQELYDDIMTDRFAQLISYITDAKIFFDPGFHGGGLHLGVGNALLEMHADYNYHPKNKNWYRYLNLLLYLNKDWKPEYGGSLKLEDARTGEKTEVEPLFNRLAIMHCRGYTLHGYDTTNFPEGMYRTSFAIYGYTHHDKPIEKPRTTVWRASDGSPWKKALAKIWLPVVAVKKKLLG